MKKNQFGIALLVPALFSLVVMSCTKDKTTDTNSPSFHIAETERLLIPAAVDLPTNLPGGNTRVVTFYAEGVQKYRSQEIAGSNPVAYQWVFVAPLADLYDATNKKVGTHSAGPTWQLTGGTDSIFGQTFTPARTATSSDPSSIDWLLLMPKAGKTPTGIFANVSYIQRIATLGGKAPNTPPAIPTEIFFAKYTAIYRFTKQN